MTAKNFNAALAKVLVHEGGYVNHPRDPGGETNKGVTKRVYDGYRKGKGLSARSVKHISPQEVAAIYKKQYWDAIQGDQLPSGVDYVVFDGAVNSGPKQSIKWLQRALGVTADGVLGMVTLEAINRTGNHDNLIARICDRRMAFLRALRTWGDFGKGWKRRVDDVEHVGKAMAVPGTHEAVPVNFIDGGQNKALIEDAKASPSKGPGDATTGIGGGGLGIAGAMESLRGELVAYTDVAWVGKIVVVLLVAGAVLTAGGLAYRWYAKRREAALNDALDRASA